MPGRSQSGVMDSLAKRAVSTMMPSYMARKRLTYARAGVDIARGDALVDRIAPAVRRTMRKEVEGSIGGFAALARLPARYKRPRLVLSTDGVGTKILIAKEMRRFDTVGIDLVAMSVNDVLTVGAEPFLVLDYYATGRLSVAEASTVIRGIARGCRQAGCALVGGETAEMPKVYAPGDFDLAGFCVGLVEGGRVVTGSGVRAGDSILGFPSSGVHSNGYSLVRAILSKRRVSLRARPRLLGGRTVGEELLKPTRIYADEVMSLIRRVPVRAMAHITGSGLPGNLTRSFPRGLNAALGKGSWPVPPIFRYLQAAGGVSEAEMYRTFNMGIGFAVVVRASDAARAMRVVPGARLIGRVVRRRGGPAVVWE